jgi:hypothetical protein
MAYRLHGNNAVGMPVTNLGWRLRTAAQAVLYPTAERQARRARRLREMREHALKLGVSAEVVQHLDAAARHADFRGNLPRDPITRMRRVLEEKRAGNYHAWSSGRTSVLHDLFIAN